MNPVKKLYVFRLSLLLVGVLLLAAFMRLYRISEYMTFLGDEGRDALVVYNILHGKLTLLGPTASVGGFFLGPIYYYFMTPFLYLFNYDPVGPAVMVALFGIATVYLVYRVGSEFFDRRAGVIAAALYAISPLTIAYSRSSWNPNLMPFFSLATLYVLYHALGRKKRWFFIACGVLLGITMQLHYLATFLATIIAAYALFMRWVFKEPRRILFILRNVIADYFFVFLGFLVGWSPFLAFELRHGFPNLQSIVRFITASEETGISSNFLGVFQNVTFRIFGRLVTRFPPPEQVSVRTDSVIGLWYYATVFLAFSSILFLLVRLVAAWRNNREEFSKLTLLTLWLLFGVSLFGFYQKSIYDYYFGFLFPLPFILVGGILSSLLSLGKVPRFLAVLGIVVLIVTNLAGVPFRSPANRQKEQVKLIANFVLEKAEGKPFNFALITGGNSDHGYRYFFRLAGRDPVVIQNPQIDPNRSTVTKQLLIVCETPCSPLGDPLWEVAGFGRAETVGRWHVSVVEVYKLVPYKGS